MALRFPDVDEELVEKIVDKLKSQGIFDQFRKDCLADVDSRPAYQNLRDKVNGAVADFLSNQPWQDDLNKNKVRESLRKHVQQRYLEVGVNRIVEQVVNPKIFTVFTPKVEDIVYQVMGIEKPTNAEDRSHSRLRFLMSNTIAQPSSSDFTEILPTDLDPVSPGSINESGNESANLNDSITSKTIDDADNISRDVNKESNLDVNEASNDSKVSGMSDLSSHGSTTKLDISESAHLPGDKSEIISNMASSRNQSVIGENDRSKGLNDNVTGPYDFDNFSNLKEKLMKTDPLNKNLDKDKIESISCHAIETTNIVDEKSMDDEIKESKDLVSFSSNNEENRIDKNPIKSPISFMYSEDSMASNCSQRSKMKLEKLNLLNESTRNSLVMDCDDTSTSFTDKKIVDVKESESVSCSEAFKDESQMSLASNDSRRFSSFSNVKSANENSRNRSEASSPDLSKTTLEDKKKEDRYRKSSHSSQKSVDKSNKYDSKHRSRDSSRERKSSKSSSRVIHDDRSKKRESDSKRDSYSHRDRYSSRGREDRHKSESKSSRYSDNKSSYDDSKKDNDYKRNSNYDDKKRSDEESKRKSRGKDYNSDNEKRQKIEDVKGSEGKDKDKDSKASDKTVNSKENKTSSEYKSYRKEETKRSSEDQKSLKLKEKDSKYSSEYKSSSDKNTKSSEDDKYSKKDRDLKKPLEDSKSCRRKEDPKSSASYDKESKSSSYDRKSSGNRSKEDDKYPRKDKEVRISDDKPLKKSDGNTEDEKSSKTKYENSGDKNKSDQKLNSDRKYDAFDRDKKKSSSSSESSSKNDEKDPKKRKRENCSEDIEKREGRRSRDRDDGGSRNNGASTTKDQKDIDDKKKKSSSNKQERTGTNSSKGTKETLEKPISPAESSNHLNVETSHVTATKIDIDENHPSYFKKLAADNFNSLETHYCTNENSEHENIAVPLVVDEIQDLNKSYINHENGLQKSVGHPPDQGMVNTMNIHSANIVGDLNQNKISSVKNPNIEIAEEDGCDDIYEFYGFDIQMVDTSYKMAVNLENYMRHFYRTESSLALSSDNCFSVTDNNLNNIDLINENSSKTEIVESADISQYSPDESGENNMAIIKSVTDSSDVRNQLPDPILSLRNIKNTNLNKFVKQNVSNSSKKIAEDQQSKDSEQVKMGEDVISLCESSSSERGFSLPSVTEDMLDNFMMENIMGKSDGCYNSSDSEIENGPTLPSEINGCMKINSERSSDMIAGNNTCKTTIRNAEKNVESEINFLSREEPALPLEYEKEKQCPIKMSLEMKGDRTKQLQKEIKKMPSLSREVENNIPIQAKEVKMFSSVESIEEIRNTTLVEEESSRSEKNESPKDDKKTSPRTSQRYNSSDLYKPRPLIPNSSRRNRVSKGSEITRGKKRPADSIEFSENKRPR